jgi:uncharacterized membrane protein YraQ (UPF0718 family)
VILASILASVLASILALGACGAVPGVEEVK